MNDIKTESIEQVVETKMRDKDSIWAILSFNTSDKKIYLTSEKENVFLNLLAIYLQNNEEEFKKFVDLVNGDGIFDIILKKKA
jgi:hypothetical protein